MSRYDHLIGKELGSGLWSWDSDKALLYAVGVGTGLDDPLKDRQFTTENTPGLPQQVIPSFLSLMSIGGAWTQAIDFYENEEYPTGVVHGEHSITVARPIPPAGAARVSQKVIGVYDKGSGALVIVESTVTLEGTGELLGTSRMGVFGIGRGGFGGPRAPADETPWARPERAPDTVVSLPVALNQALIYRLLGDRNLHGTDPDKAREDGFDRPAFFGLGTFGFVCRALLRGLCDGDVARFGRMDGRFSKSVHPGDRLDTLIWRTDGGAVFQVLANGERVVFDRGVFRFSAGAGAPRSKAAAQAQAG